MYPPAPLLALGCVGPISLVSVWLYYSSSGWFYFPDSWVKLLPRPARLICFLSAAVSSG